MLWLQSSISTVAQELWYSHWCTCRSVYSRLSGTCAPSRRMAENSVALTSRFRASPNSYCLVEPLVSIPVARSRVSWRPKLLRPSEPSRSRSEQRGANIQVQGVAELVLPGGAVGLDPGGEVARIVAPEAAPAQRAQ